MNKTLLCQTTVSSIRYFEATSVSACQLNRFVAEKPLVEELILKNHHLESDDTINFIRKMKSLKRFGFQVKDDVECDRIEGELRNEWELGSRTPIHRVCLNVLEKYFQSQCVGAVDKNYSVLPSYATIGPFCRYNRPHSHQCHTQVPFLAFF